MRIFKILDVGLNPGHDVELKTFRLKNTQLLEGDLGTKQFDRSRIMSLIEKF